MWKFENHLSGALSSTALSTVNGTACDEHDLADLVPTAVDQPTEWVDIRATALTASRPFAVIAADPIDYSI